MSDDPVHVENDNLTETRISPFQLATMVDEVVLTCADQNPDGTRGDWSEQRETRDDTKFRMTPETAVQPNELSHPIDQRT